MLAPSAPVAPVRHLKGRSDLAISAQSLGVLLSLEVRHSGIVQTSVKP